jgi:hypothetical protein
MPETHSRTLLLDVFVTAFTAALSAASLAQTSPSPPGNTAPEASPQTPNDKSPDAPLSEKLDKNEGVLKPPKGIDPEMHKAPPESTGDRMPVIIPPGEPGGDQSVQPK